MVVTRSRRVRLETFQFLQLPPELRERVYELVLGGNVVHVGDQNPEIVPTDGGIRNGICAANITDADIVQSSGCCPDTWNSSRHRECFRDTSPRLRLDLLLTCKEIHAEAKAAPFQYNTFSFGSHMQLAGFAKLIGNDRFHCIRQVLLYSANLRRCWAIPNPQTAMLPFGHLQSLDVFIELCAGEFMTTMCDTLDTEAAQDEAFGGLKTFGKFSPRRVRVIINDKFMRRPEGSMQGYRGLLVSQKASQVDVVAWAERIKCLITGRVLEEEATIGS